MAITELIEKPDCWVIPAHGREVTQCRVDYAFGIESWESSTSFASFRIAGKFTFQMNEDEYYLSAEEQPMSLGPALGILHQTIDSAIAYKDGTLEMRFSNGTRITVLVDPNYEAWEANGSKGLHIVCYPGGGLGVWQPE